MTDYLLIAAILIGAATLAYVVWRYPPHHVKPAFENAEERALMAKAASGTKGCRAAQKAMRERVHAQLRADVSK